MSVSDVALVIDLNQDVAPTVVEYPTSGVIGGAQYGRLVLQPLVLAKIEIAKNDHHPELVGPVHNTLQAGRVVRAQGAVLFESRVVPRLCAHVTSRRTTLQVDGKGEQPVPPPFGHCGNELASVAL